MVVEGQQQFAGQRIPGGPVQGRLSLGVTAARRSGGERAQKASAVTSGTTAAAGGMVTERRGRGKGLKGRLGRHILASRFTETSPNWTERRPVGCEGGVEGVGQG